MHNNSSAKRTRLLFYIMLFSSKSGSYFVEKGKLLMHTRNCRNQASKSFIDLIGTTLIEDPGHCTQLCRLQLPSKMIIVF